MSTRDTQGGIFLKQEKEMLFFAKLGRKERNKEASLSFGMRSDLALGLRDCTEDKEEDGVPGRE